MLFCSQKTIRDQLKEMCYCWYGHQASRWLLWKYSSASDSQQMSLSRVLCAMMLLQVLATRCQCLLTWRLYLK